MHGLAFLGNGLKGMRVMGISILCKGQMHCCMISFLIIRDGLGLELLESRNWWGDTVIKIDQVLPALHAFKVFRAFCLPGRLVSLNSSCQARSLRMASSTQKENTHQPQHPQLQAPRGTTVKRSKYMKVPEDSVDGFFRENGRKAMYLWKTELNRMFISKCIHMHLPLCTSTWL